MNVHKSEHLNSLGNNYIGDLSNHIMLKYQDYRFVVHKKEHRKDMMEQW